MDATKIRETSGYLINQLRESMSKEDSLRLDQAKMYALAALAITTFLAEIAAQLAEMNEQIKPGLAVKIEGP